MKDNLPYFSHDNNARRHPKMKALIAEFGYEGYGRFWALNERIAESSGAYIDISKKVNKLDLAQELGLNNDGLDRFLKFLSDPEIDLINIKNNKITTDRISEIFEKTMENREDERERKKTKNGKEDFPPGKDEIPPGKEKTPDDFRPEKHTDKTKQDKTKQDKNLPPEKNNPEKIKLLDREPKNDLERVNKKWLENYITLFGNEPFSPPWNLSSPLVKKALKQAGAEKVLKALDTARQDKFCLDSGYILKIIMSGNVLSRLINSKSAYSEEQKFGELLEGTVDISALYKQFGLTGTESEKRQKLIELRDQGEVSF
jgi:hypothetical protein